MKVAPLPSFACLSIAFALLGVSRVAAGAPVDPLAAEAEVRKADAEWSAAASSHSVEAWMSFYAADAVVRFPQDQLASGKELVREAVIRFLAPAHLSMASRPIDVEVSPSANVASLIESYELRFDSHGASVSSRGRRLEIWKKQADGSWKCVTDTWNFDESPGAPSAALPAGAPMARGAAVAAEAAGTAETPAIAGATGSAVAPTVRGAPVSPAARPEAPTSPPAAAVAAAPAPPPHEPTTRYGDPPANYEQTVRQYFQDHLAHPENVQYREITPPEQGYVDRIAGAFLMQEKRIYGWIVKATLNTQDSHEKYIGYRTYNFLFRGEKIVDARSALTGEQIK